MIDWQLIWEMRSLIAQGLWNTIWICFLGCLMAIFLGLALASLRMAHKVAFGWLITAYVEVCRGVPLLVILFLLYYGGPSFGLRLEAEVAGVVGIGLYGAGFFAEIFRSGFQSIPIGQVEAAQMLGISRWHILTRVQIPQMLRLIVPPGTNQTIILIKESALLSIISVDDLTKNATAIVNQTFIVVEPYLVVALLYWMIIELIARGGFFLERHLDKGTHLPRKPLRNPRAGSS
jgi:polar amino acid transport system permease protein